MKLPKHYIRSLKIDWKLEKLSLKQDMETKKVLKSLRAALAELKGISATIPNQNISINTLVL